MKLQDLYSLIALPSDAADRLEAVGRELYLPRLDGLLDPDTAREAYRQLKDTLPEDSPDHWKLLYCYLECARRARANYRKRGIPDQIYLDTMSCFSRFLAEDRNIYGRPCFLRGWWTYRQTSMRLFRIGALEYELRARGGRPVIDLHIPSDADFSPASVDRSLEQAEDFFRTYFPEYGYEACTCDSWLLSPRLEPLLSRRSNILSFQRRFQILGETPEDREYIQWLFQVPEDTETGRLPENTSLQRRVKALLLEGGAVGCAFGILNR